MTPLILITTHPLQARRITGRTVGPAFHLDPEASAAELRQDIEQLRRHGEPVRTTAESVFDAMAEQLENHASI